MMRLRWQFVSVLGLSALLALVTIHVRGERMECAPPPPPLRTKTSDGAYLAGQEESRTTLLVNRCFQRPAEWDEVWSDYPERGGHLVYPSLIPVPSLGQGGP